MTSLYGKVLSVETRNLSEPVVATASIGATSLVVADASTFDENGGVIVVNGDQLAYTATDVDTDTLTLAVALVTAVADQDLAEVYPATPVKTATVDLGEDGDPIPATVLHSLLDKLPDGIRVAGSEESVTIEQRGTYEFVVADLVGEILTQQSLKFTEGEEGYGLTEAGVQMEDAQVTGELGAAVVSADQMLVSGQDLIADILAPIPRSTTYAMRGTAGNINAGLTSGTTELRFFVFDAGPVAAGRLYNVGFRALGQGTVGDVFWSFMRYTTDGSEPTVSSPIMPGGQTMVPIISAGIGRGQVGHSAFFPAAADGQLRIAVTFQRLSGTGTMTIRTDSESFSIQAFKTDLGVDSDASTALQQTAKVDGSGADNPPETTKVYTQQCTHAEYWMGFAGSAGAAYSADTGDANVGWQQDLLHGGNDRPDFTVLHFNHAAIVSALSTATSITSVQLKFKVKSRAAAAGLDLSVFAHKYSTYPHSMAGDYVTEVAAGRIVTGQGSKNDAAPGATYIITLSAGVGTNLKSGLYKGIGVTSTVFTAAGVGDLFANPSVDRPTLIITYKSPA